LDHNLQLVDFILELLKMNFKELKIGYVPYLPDLSQPADRRRFPFFAKSNHIPFEIADVNKSYDIILLTAPSNLSKWLIYKKKNPKTKFIFEIVDSLIFPSYIFSTLFKGLGRFLLGKESLLYLNYKSLIIRWFRLADIVVCSNTELKNSIEKWNKNVVISLDYLENEYKFLKKDFSINGKLKLLWEGQGVVLRHFLFYRDLFEQLDSFCELHVITSKKYPSFGNLKQDDVKKIIEQLPIKTIVHQWDFMKNTDVFRTCDCGIIPLNKRNLLGWHKPANKLISFWFSGLPTVVSDTPAYKEIMNKAGENLLCSDAKDWINKITFIKNMTAAERETLAKKNFEFVRLHYSNEALDKVWYQIFNQLIQINDRNI
jgi:glycosyltransferase involved in cell wall biosynthesis